MRVLLKTCFWVIFGLEISFSELKNRENLHRRRRSTMISTSTLPTSILLWLLPSTGSFADSHPASNTSSKHYCRAFCISCCIGFNCSGSPSLPASVVVVIVVLTIRPTTFVWGVCGGVKLAVGRWWLIFVFFLPPWSSAKTLGVSGEVLCRVGVSILLLLTQSHKKKSWINIFFS